MATITGVGAVIIFSNNPRELAAWYGDALGIPTQYSEGDGCYYGSFGSSERTVQFAIYTAKEQTGELTRSIMINYEVDDLDLFISALDRKGVTIESTLDIEYGRFASIRDPEGNRIELWQAPVADPTAAADSGFNPQIKELEARPSLGIRTTTTMERIGAELGSILPEVWQFAISRGMHPAGPPYTRYYRFSDTVIDMEGGLPLSAPLAGEGRVVGGEPPAGKFATAWHVGPYEALGSTWRALEGWLRDQGLEAGEECWEVYWTDPGVVKNPDDYKTELYWSLR